MSVSPAPGFRPVPVEGHAVTWTTWDGASSERCTLRWENEAWTVEGRVGGVDVHYVLRLSAGWQVQQLLLFRDLPEPDLWLATDGGGRWGEVNGAHRAELDGCTELALGCTPLTHSLPIRRLPLHVGDSAEVDVVTVDVETLAVEREHRRYTRIDDRRWLVRTGAGTASAEHELVVDDFGLVVDEPGRFHRAG
jgi:hypothetical protein